ncbi:hypothetical protein FLAV_01400 [Flavobacteriales bacterium]|nr:hypothetical protein [Bacteroidota bacterium]MBV6460038.1 hypothetical protein [Flavobacteriales bacterium]CAG0974089.1 hypothetical protein FLAV_01400 [Flavobacteriales bacterium]
MLVLSYLRTAIVLFIIPLHIHCKNSKTMNVKENTSITEKPSTNVTEEVESPKYPLFISFYSIGEGINTEALEKFESFLTDFLMKNKLNNIGEEKIYWGREGEIDYCISFTNVNQSIISDFINQTKKLLSNYQHVTIKEENECVHKR